MPIRSIWQREGTKDERKQSSQLKPNLQIIMKFKGRLQFIVKVGALPTQSRQ
jgi:hypothetical protein